MEEIKGIMIDQVRKTIQNYHMLEQGDRVVVGVSGGPDSVALFMTLVNLRKEYAMTLYVVHVDHQLRKASVEEAEYVENLCREYQIVCDVYHKDIIGYARELHCSVEEAGRNYRYQCFKETAMKYGCTKLAVAHHRNDRVETMLFRMARGTGLKGLQGIPAVRELGEACTIIRPLYDTTRKEIEDYVSEHGYQYYIDESNQDDQYARNRIRNRIIPEMNLINTQAVAHMAELSENCTEYWSYVEQQAVQYERDRIHEHVLRVSELMECPKLLQRHILYRQLIQVAGQERDLEQIHVEAVLALLGSQGEKRIVLPYRIVAVKAYDQLMIYRENAESTGMENGPETDRCIDDPDALKAYRCLRIHSPYIWNVNSSLITTAEDISVLPAPDPLVIAGLGKWSAVIKYRDQIGEISKKNYTKMLNYDTINGALCVRNPQAGDYMVIDACGTRKRISRLLIDQKIPRSLREQLVIVADGTHVVWIPGIRISEAYKITDDTRYVLELSLELL